MVIATVQLVVRADILPAKQFEQRDWTLVEDDTIELPASSILRRVEMSLARGQTTPSGVSTINLVYNTKLKTFRSVLKLNPLRAELELGIGVYGRLLCQIAAVQSFHVRFALY